MTKYVLNSGGASKYPQKDKLFVEEILAGFSGKLKILYCFFAQPRDVWESKFESYKKNFERLNEERKDLELAFVLALPEIFVKQVGESDVIFILGGENELLKNILSKFDLPKIWENKIVATSSAGSDVVSDSFWTCDWRQCMDGLGLLPIKFIPHYNSNYGIDDPRGPIDWKKAHEELEEYGDKKLPIYALQEGDYVVIEN